MPSRSRFADLPGFFCSHPGLRLPAALPWLVGALSALLWQSTLHAVTTGSFQGFHFRNENNQITILGYTGGNGAITIPALIQQVPVIAIADEAFRNNATLTSVTIPSGVLSIGTFAFSECPNLAGVSIPASVTSIGTRPFRACRKLTGITVNPASASYASVGGVLLDKALTTVLQAPGGLAGTYAIPATVTTITERAFSDCDALTGITIPPATTTIGGGAFERCDALAGVTIPASVTTIGSGAFQSCSGLTSLTLEPGLATLGSSMFLDCYRLDSVTIPGSIALVPGAFSGCSGLTSVTLQEGLTALGTGAFGGCSKLAAITLPSTLVSIGNYAFYDCTVLAEIAIPAGVVSIGATAFSSCPSLAAITVDPANPNYASLGGVLFDKSLQTLLQAPGALTGAYSVPSHVVSIANGAFSFSPHLSSVSLPANVTSLGTYAFSYCPELVSVTIAGPISAIPEGFFLGCTSLASLDFPASVTSIGISAFADCRSLAEITLPPNLTSIGENAFSSCLALTNLSFPASLTVIGHYAFSYCSGLTHVTVPAGVSLGARAFTECSGLSSITIAEGVTTIPEWCFAFCPSLTQVTLPASLASLGQRAFGSCPNLASVTFLGDAPATMPDPFAGAAGGFTVFYLRDAAGFTSPTWLGYPAEAYGLAPNNFPIWVAAAGLTGATTTTQADPDADGLPNLLEYAFGTTPTEATSATLFPACSLQTDTATLVYTHRRRKNSGLVFIYKTSANLAIPVDQWNIAALVPSVIDPDVDGNGQTELVSVSLPLDAIAPLFLTLTVGE